MTSAARRLTSAIDLRKDGRFNYSYNGEIYLLGLSKLAELGSKAKEAEPFKAVTCYTDDEEMKERECTKDELAKQKADWEEDRKADEARKKRDSDMMKVMLGGIDPSSPQAAEELAQRLRRQAGWKSVVYKGDGLFVVDFAISLCRAQQARRWRGADGCPGLWPTCPGQPDGQYGPACGNGRSTRFGQGW
jgi:hypothetical protein